MPAPNRSLGRAIASKLRSSIRAVMGDFFGFKQRLSSGILVVARRPSDFATFSEIFVDSFYDQALHEAIENSSDGVHLLDLGSNVGFFALRFADLVQRHHPDHAAKPVKITMVEGVDTVARESLVRLALNTGKVGECEVLNGLVGKTSGFERISSEYEYGHNSIIASARGRTRTKQVPCLDLQERLSGRVFDLIKCGIEGAEEMFLDAYRDLLARQRRIVFEFHRKLCDTARCNRLLLEMGVQRLEIYSNEDISMVYYR